jgi:curved DNA-binding protein CbpA
LFVFAFLQILIPSRSDATFFEIKRAYKKKALLHHPDKQASSSPQAARRAADRMQKINQA